MNTTLPDAITDWINPNHLSTLSIVVVVVVVVVVVSATNVCQVPPTVKQWNCAIIRPLKKSVIQRCMTRAWPTLSL